MNFTSSPIALVLMYFSVLISTVPVALGVGTEPTSRKTTTTTSTPSLVHHHLDSLLNGSEFRGGGEIRKVRPPFTKEIQKTSSVLLGSSLMDGSIIGDIFKDMFPTYDLSMNYITMKERILDRLRISDMKERAQREIDSATSDVSTRTWSAYDAPTATPSSPTALESFEEEQNVHHPFVKIIPDRESENDSDFVPFSDVQNDDNNGNKALIEEGESRPVVYRYFGRARNKFDSVPLILLGPCADHWKATGNILASRGYSVMACEEVVEDDRNGVESHSDPDSINDDRNKKTRKNRNGGKLVFSILEALRWKRAVIVGCDNNAKAAIEAALHLAPSRVAGLVLCGDLTEAEAFVKEYQDDKRKVTYTLDDFLKDNVSCPCTIICDIDVDAGKYKHSKIHSSIQSFQHTKSLRRSIVGGGLSPHRRLPEQFAWMLSRFTEERVVPHDLMQSSRSSSIQENLATKKASTIVSPGSLLVSGRVIASTIMYLSAVSVCVYQYKNLKCGLSEIKSHWEQISIWRRKGFNFLMKVIAADVSRKQRVIPMIGRKFRKWRGNDSSKDEEVEVNSLESNEVDGFTSGEDHDKAPFPKERIHDIFRMPGFDYVTS